MFAPQTRDNYRESVWQVFLSQHDFFFVLLFCYLLCCSFLTWFGIMVQFASHPFDHERRDFSFSPPSFILLHPTANFCPFSWRIYFFFCFTLLRKKLFYSLRETRFMMMLLLFCERTEAVFPHCVLSLIFLCIFFFILLLLFVFS